MSFLYQHKVPGGRQGPNRVQRRTRVTNHDYHSTKLKPIQY